MLDVFHDSKYSSVAMFKIHIDDLAAKEKNIIVINNHLLKLSIDFRSMLLFIKVDANLIHAILQISLDIYLSIFEDIFFLIFR